MAPELHTPSPPSAAHEFLVWVILVTEIGENHKKCFSICCSLCNAHADKQAASIHVLLLC